jgi:hypothetical protein
MAKKTTARPAAKPSQQRSKEDQWRRRMAQQSQMGASSSTVAEPGVEMDSASGTEVGAGATQAATGRAATRAGSGAATKRATNVSAVTQRANLAGARSARVRLSASTLPLAEEMHYIRGDIVKLGILTAICLVVLFALAVIVPSIIK